VTFKSHIVALNDALRHPSLACMRQFVGMFGAIREANQRATRAAGHNTLPGGRITSPALPQVSDSESPFLAWGPAERVLDLYGEVGRARMSVLFFDEPALAAYDAVAKDKPRLVPVRHNSSFELSTRYS